MTKQYDAAIVGGGLAGLTMALALGRQGLFVAHFSPSMPPDRRTSALMMPVCHYLQSLGLYDTPTELGEALTHIRLIDATDRLLRAPETLFSSASEGLEAFSYNFANMALSERLAAALAPLSNIVTFETSASRFERMGDGRWRVTADNGEELSAHLLIGADGKKSMVRAAAGIAVREHKFAQSALVCDLTLDRPLNGESVEFHYANGPFTLVPAGDKRANLVWVDRHDVLEAAKALDQATFEAKLRDKSRGLFGQLSLDTGRFVFPLSTLSVSEAGRDGIALIGEAAHAFPPIGAQGLNLGLRDVEDLAAKVAATDRARTGWASKVTFDYAQSRASDIGDTTRFVDALFRSLLSDFLPAQAVRAGGIWTLKALAPVRRKAFEVGMGARGDVQNAQAR